MARWRGPDVGRSGTAALLLFALLSLGADAGAPDELRFALHSEAVAVVDVAGLKEAVSSRTIRVFDPYEERVVAFEAFPFAGVLDFIYSSSWRSEEEILFTCSDGYQPTVPVQRVVDHEAWLAFDRTDAVSFSIDKFESGAQRRVMLAPYYLVWENIDDDAIRSEGDYGWPYQLVGVDLIRSGDRFPRMLPPDGASERELAGFAAFRMHCSRCHAVNGDGGTIGPDLNIPVNPVEHREKEWLRRWIDDPSAILATTRMPRLNPALPERDETIENILAYLGAMSRAKPTPGTFEAFYDSSLQHPILLWLAAGAALAFSASRRRLDTSMRRYCIALGVLSLSDAWLTSSHVFGMGSLPAPLGSFAPLFFVLAGDARYLLLLTATTRDGRIEARARSMLQAAGLTLVVPLATQLAMTAVPDSPQSSRVMFLIYEVAFTCLTLALLRWHPKTRSTPWLRRVSRFVILYYGLWATADALILFGGQDAGFLLRVLPNLLYYGGLIAVIARLAPEDSGAKA